MRGAGVAAILGLVLGAGAASAGDWRITPSIGLTEEFTDNARSTSNNRDSDLITTVSPGLTVIGEGRQLTLDFDYTFSYDKYLSNTDLDGYRQSFIGGGRTELIREAVFLDMRGSISQEYIDRRGQITATERSGAGNQTDVYTYSVSPYWQNRFGSFAESELRYRFAQTFFGNPSSGTSDQFTNTTNAASDSTTNQVSANLVSGSDFGNLLWRLSGDGSNTERDVGTLEVRTGEAAIQYAITRQVSLLTGGGYDSIEDPTLVRDLSGPFWNVGLQLTPSPRTKLRVLGGRRYNDSNYAGELSYQVTPRILVSANYTDTILTTQTQFLTSIDNIERDQYGNFVDKRTNVAYATRAAGDFPLTDEVFREKAATARIGYRGDRNSAALTFFRTDRESQSAPIDSTAQNEKVTGVSFNVGRRLNEVLDAGLFVSYEHGQSQDITGGPESSSDNTYRATASLGYTFNPTLRGALSYSYLNRQSTGGGTPFGSTAGNNSDDVVENVVFVTVRKFF